MTKFQVTASVYSLGNVGYVVRVVTKTHVFIGHLRNWCWTHSVKPPCIAKIEIYTVVQRGRRKGAEEFVGEATPKVEALLVPALLAAAERCRRERRLREGW